MRYIIIIIIIIYAVLNPTPKGVGYDLNIHFAYFRNPKVIAPIEIGRKSYSLQTSTKKTAQSCAV